MNILRNYRFIHLASKFKRNIDLEKSAQLSLFKTIKICIEKFITTYLHFFEFKSYTLKNNRNLKFFFKIYDNKIREKFKKIQVFKIS